MTRLTAPTGERPRSRARWINGDPSGVQAGHSRLNDLGSPVLGSPVLGSPVLGPPVLGSPVLGSPVLGPPVLGPPVSM